MSRKNRFFILIFAAILVTRLNAEDVYIPDISGNDAIGIGNQEGFVALIKSMPEIFGAIYSGLEHTKGDTLEDKSKHLMAAGMCIKGDKDQKMDTIRALLQLGKDAKKLPKQTALSGKLEIAKKYWTKLIKPLAGNDGIINVGDVDAIANCLKQSELDRAARHLIETSAYAVVNQFAEDAINSSRHPRIVAAVAYNRRVPAAKANIDEKYEKGKVQIRTLLEQKIRDNMTQVLKNEFKVSKEPYKEPLCKAGSMNDEWRRISVFDAMDCVKDMTGFDAFDFGNEVIWNKFYYHTPVPKVEDRLKLPKMNGLSKMGVAFEFPQGIPIREVEGALLRGELPTGLSIGMREETRTVDGKDQLVKVFEVEPQPLGLGLNSRDTEFQSPDGKKVRYGVITNIFPGSPAEKAGIKVGDYIQKINGDDLANKGDAEILKRVELQARSHNRKMDFAIRRLNPSTNQRETIELSAELNPPCDDSARALSGIKTQINQVIDQIPTHSK